MITMQETVEDLKENLKKTFFLFIWINNTFLQEIYMVFLCW
jgi:hypothetical protein